MIDLISRQDAIDLICGECLIAKMDGRCIDDFCDDIQNLKNMPSAQKKGKNISKDGFLCSVCGFGDFGGFHAYKPNFCPNCGADMRPDYAPF